jgi:hypothetical protein
MLTSHPVHAEDVARLEYALRASFEAGEAPPIAASELASASIALQPHVQLLALRTGADTLWRRCERGEHRGSLAHATAKASRFVAVYRQSHDLHVERLPRAAFEILSAVDETRSLDAAMDRVLAIPALLRRRDSERIQRWFAAWTAAGWFRRAGHDSAPSSDNRRCTSSMRTWLIGILRHKILDHFRWQSGTPVTSPSATTRTPASRSPGSPASAHGAQTPITASRRSTPIPPSLSSDPSCAPPCNLASITCPRNCITCSSCGISTSLPPTRPPPPASPTTAWRSFCIAPAGPACLPAEDTDRDMSHAAKALAGGLAGLANAMMGFAEYLLGIGCRSFIRLVSARYERPLGPGERLRQSIHRAMCRICRQQELRRAQLRGLAHDIGQMSADSADESQRPSIELSPKAMARIRRAMDKATNRPPQT